MMNKKPDYMLERLRNDEDEPVCSVRMMQCPPYNRKTDRGAKGKCASIYFVFDAGVFNLVGIQRSELRRLGKFILDTVADMNSEAHNGAD